MAMFLLTTSENEEREREREREKSSFSALLWTSLSHLTIPNQSL